MSLQLRWPRRPPPPLLASAPGMDDREIAADETVTAIAVLDYAVTAAVVAVADAAMRLLSPLPLPPPPPPPTQSLRAPLEAAVASETACCKQHVVIVHDTKGNLSVTMKTCMRGTMDTVAQ